jgi:predicted HAD superfamily Cof-like phosphohydrolase
MSKVFNDVSVFMAAAGQTIREDNKEQAALYHKLIVEEYEEFISARQYNDDVETIDACFDMLWVIVGYMHSRGWDCNGIWDEGALSNLRKIDKETRKVIKREDGKILKPEGWTKPDFTKFVKANI